MSIPRPETEGSPSPSSGGPTQPDGGNPSFMDRYRILLIIGSVALMALSFLLEVPLVTALLFGVPASWYFTYVYVKEEDKDSASFVAFTAAVLCLLHLFAGVFGYWLYSTTERLWMIPLMLVVGLWAFYRYHSGWNVWPIAHRVGAGIFGVASALLYWGLTIMDILTIKELVLVAFLGTWAIVLLWVYVNVWLEEHEILPGTIATTEQGSGVGIRRYGKFQGVIFNDDGDIPRTELNPSQDRTVRKFRLASRFNELEAWAKREGLEYDPRWDRTPYFLRFRGKRWQIPAGGDIQPCPHQLNLRNLGDIESVGQPHFTEGGLQFTLLPLFDVDVQRKSVSTGGKTETLKRIIISVDRLRLRQPRKFMAAASNWIDRWNTTMDGWGNAVGTTRGNDALDDAGKELREIIGPELVNKGMAILASMGFGSTDPVLKEVQASDGTVAAQQMITIATAKAAAIVLTRGAEYQALEGVLDRGGITDEGRRAEIINRVLPFLLANDNNAATTTLGEMGVGVNLVGEMMRASRRDAN